MDDGWAGQGHVESRLASHFGLIVRADGNEIITPKFTNGLFRCIICSHGALKS